MSHVASTDVSLPISIPACALGLEAEGVGFRHHWLLGLTGVLDLVVSALDLLGRGRIVVQVSGGLPLAAKGAGRVEALTVVEESPNGLGQLSASGSSRFGLDPHALLLGSDPVADSKPRTAP